MRRDGRPLGLILGGLAAIALAAGIAWFLDNFERQTREIPAGASPEARRNPLLALERFLARLDIPVESVPGRTLLWEPPGPADTLVVRGLGPLAAERRARLRAWMESGGSLVAEAVEPWEDDDEAAGRRDAHPDSLLADFGIRLRYGEGEDEGDGDGRDEGAGSAAPGTDAGECRVPAPGAAADGASGALASTDDDPDGESFGEARTQVRLDGIAAPLTVAFEPDWSLDTGDIEGDRVQARGRIRLIRIPVGEGSLTVLSDTELFTNARLGRHDHALLAAYLVLPGPGGKVWLLYDSAVPWLGALLWAWAPLALISAGVLIAVWLWALGARLGPLAPPPGRRRRDLVEHLDASADFLWRHGRASHLVEPTRHRVLADWERHRPALRRLDRAGQARVIAEAVGRPPEAVAEALAGQSDDARSFVVTAARLQELWQRARPTQRLRDRRRAAGKNSRSFAV